MVYEPSIKDRRETLEACLKFTVCSKVSGTADTCNAAYCPWEGGVCGFALPHLDEAVASQIEFMQEAGVVFGTPLVGGA